MSKIGRLAIKLPEGVKIEAEGQVLKASGPKGVLTWQLPKGVTLERKEEDILLSSKEKTRQGKAVYGTARSKVANMLKGVAEGWVKKLELVGTGYRAEVIGDTLSLLVGYSHPIKIKAPEGIFFKVEKTLITVEGADKELVGQTAAKIRFIRPPEPYKGKGIKYEDEVIKRKAGKVAKTQGVVPA